VHRRVGSDGQCPVLANAIQTLAPSSLPANIEFLRSSAIVRSNFFNRVCKRGCCYLIDPFIAHKDRDVRPRGYSKSAPRGVQFNGDMPSNSSQQA